PAPPAAQPPKSAFPPSRTTIHISGPPVPAPPGHDASVPTAGASVPGPLGASPEGPEPASAPAGPLPEGRERALAVDDDPDSLEAVSSFLEDHGFEVDRADGTKSARRKLAKQ